MNSANFDLASKRCKPCEGGVAPLSDNEVTSLLLQLNRWVLIDSTIEKTFKFNNYYQTISFVNAIAWISHRDNHHPDLTVGYNKCIVKYTTHAINGLSENDFICASKIDKLFEI